MKKWIAGFLLILLSLNLIACTSKVEIKEDSRVTLRFHYNGLRIQRTLNSEESTRVIGILKDKVYMDNYSGNESCEFDSDVALIVDKTVFAVAKNDCGMLLNLDQNELILLSDAEYAQIGALFDTYGGYLPCSDKT